MKWYLIGGNFCVACVACSAHGKIYATRGICNIWGESKLPPMWYLMSEKLLFCACLHLIEEDIQNMLQKQS